MLPKIRFAWLILILFAGSPAAGWADEVQESAAAVPESVVEESVVLRFAIADAGGEVPDFQKHVVPLMGKLGCNGRACHGSFQGRGGFRLSLFGYDFQLDHDELYGRVNPESPDESLILMKPLMQIQHEGGQRLTPGSWEHHLLQRWIQAGSPPIRESAATLTRLEVSPSEILFVSEGETQQLSAVAVWSDGTREDVTALCRFQTNDDQIAEISEEGLVQSGARGDTHVVVFYDSAVVPVSVIRPVSDQFGARYPEVPTPTRIDELVVSRLRKIGIVQSETCTDAEFLRRASLDVTGTLPTPQEVREFLSDSGSDKRARKIDELLERPGYVAWWTTRLCDYTGNNYDTLNNVTPVQTEAARHWYYWIQRRVEQNVGYDDLVEGIVMAVSRDPGEDYQQYCDHVSDLYHKGGPGAAAYADRKYLPHFWARQNFQTGDDRVIGFAYTFLGTRIQCAQCHKHPFDRWTQQDFKEFEGFFRGTVARQNPRPDAKGEFDRMVAAIDGTEGLKGNDLRRILAERVTKGETIPLSEVFVQKAAARPKNRNAKNNKRPDRASPVPAKARLLGGAEVDLTQYDDVRQPLMDWLRSPDNPLFARAFVNRVWANYFNAGIVHPSDDLNLANPPSNAALLDYLAAGFIEHDFDMKWVHREILNSRTYQLSWIPNASNRLDERNFSHAVPRRIPAEIAYDMMVQATRNDAGNSRLVSSLEKRAVAIPGSGSRRQDNSPANYALTVFGRSVRASNCDCDRTEEPSLLQTIFVRNDAQLLTMIDDADGWLQDVASRNHLKFQARSQPDGANAAARTEQVRQRFLGQIRRLKEQLAAAEAGGNSQQADNLKQRIRTIRDQAQKAGALSDSEAADADAGAAAGPGSPEPETSAVATLNVAEILTDAWLRTLSRYPSEDELQTARAFVEESTDPVAGIRDVLWALLNTREFMVNH